MPNDRKRSNAQSAICVARLLNTEGFTEYTAGEVKRYALRSNATTRQRQRYSQVKKAFADMVKEKLNERDKIVMGKFINMLSKMQFDTGIRIGITAFLYGARVSECGVEIDE